MATEESKQQGSIPPSDDEDVVPDTQPQEVPLLYRMAAIFVGLFSIHTFQFALFMHSFPNDGRRAGEADCFQAFASPLPLNYSDRSVKKFVMGIPYKFAYHLKLLHPKQDQDLEIISAFEDISPLETKDREYVTPLVRGTFVGQDSKFCTFKVTELPDVRLYGGAPHFTVYKDQATSHPNYLEGGDSLLAIRTGFDFKGKPFTNIASLSSVIVLGNVDRVPVRDIPPTAFVNSVCKEFNVQLLVGGVDDSELLYPIISNKDILQLGRITNIKDIGEYVHFQTLYLLYSPRSTPWRLPPVVFSPR
jgi:hypothetical protein